MRQPKSVGAVDDERIGTRDIESAFDDGGGQQDVITLLVERAHPLLNLRCRHLAVRGDMLDFRHLDTQEFLDIGQVGDTRDDKEALPTAIMFAEQGFAQDHWIPRHDIGTHRQPVDRGGLDHRQVA